MRRQPQEARFEEAFSVLAQLPPSAFQPAQIMHLFPSTCARWLPGMPQRPLWGLHGSLPGNGRFRIQILKPGGGGAGVHLL